jgi:hypothetical protein
MKIKDGFCLGRGTLMKSLKDVLLKSDCNFLHEENGISLIKLTNLKIKDIIGDIELLYEDDYSCKPMFVIKNIILEDDSKVFIDTYEDNLYLSYLKENTPPNMDSDTMNNLYNEILKDIENIVQKKQQRKISHL